MSIQDILMMSDTDGVAEIKVGAIVKPLFPDSGTLAIPKVDKAETQQTFGYAIVISMSPFILASDKGNMRWESTVKIADFKAVGMAMPSALALASTRLNG